MARKKKLKIPSFVKYILFGLLLIGACVFVINKTGHVLTRADYFKVRSIAIDSSLEFIQKHDLSHLVGKNIFKVDLKTAQRRLSHKYPQASRLKIARRFPDQISVVARQRLPFAQIQIEGQTVVLDKEGVILSLQQTQEDNLPDIAGARLNNPKLMLGLPVRGPDLWVSLKIIDFFKADNNLVSYSIMEVNIENLSKIYVTFSNGLEVIMDRNKIAQKIRVLGVVLAEGQLDLKQVKYIDLRFKEPVIGKK